MIGPREFAPIGGIILNHVKKTMPNVHSTDPLRVLIGFIEDGVKSRFPINNLTPAQQETYSGVSLLLNMDGDNALIGPQVDMDSEWVHGQNKMRGELAYLLEIKQLQPFINTYSPFVRPGNTDGSLTVSKEDADTLDAYLENHTDVVLDQLDSWAYYFDMACDYLQALLIHSWYVRPSTEWFIKHSNVDARSLKLAETKRWNDIARKILLEDVGPEWMRYSKEASYAWKKLMLRVKYGSYGNHVVIEKKETDDDKTDDETDDDETDDETDEEDQFQMGSRRPRFGDASGNIARPGQTVGYTMKEEWGHGLEQAREKLKAMGSASGTYYDIRKHLPMHTLYYRHTDDSVDKITYDPEAKIFIVEYEEDGKLKKGKGSPRAALLWIDEALERMVDSRERLMKKPGADMTSFLEALEWLQILQAVYRAKARNEENVAWGRAAGGIPGALAKIDPIKLAGEALEGYAKVAPKLKLVNEATKQMFGESCGDYLGPYDALEDGGKKSKWPVAFGAADALVNRPVIDENLDQVRMPVQEWDQEAFERDAEIARHRLQTTKMQYQVAAQDVFPLIYAFDKIYGTERAAEEELLRETNDGTTLSTPNAERAYHNFVAVHNELEEIREQLANRLEHWYNIVGQYYYAVEQWIALMGPSAEDPSDTPEAVMTEALNDLRYAYGQYVSSRDGPFGVNNAIAFVPFFRASTTRAQFENIVNQMRGVRTTEPDNTADLVEAMIE